MDNISFQLGLQVAQVLQQYGIPALDYEAFRRGVEQGQNAAKEAKQKGEQFLAENAKREGVKTTASGLQYEVLESTLGQKPKATDTVKVHYEGTLIDGTVFDSSYKRGEPISFALNQVIKGWTEALVRMPVGSVWEIYVPQELAYGELEQGPIKPFSTLIFKIELLNIK